MLRAKPTADAGQDAATEADAEAGTLSCARTDAGDGLPVPEAPSPDPAIAAIAHQFFAIEVLDQDDQPVAGATLRTVAGATLVTDDTGVAAFYEPDLMDGNVFFFVSADGYEMPADGFGYRGQALSVQEGQRGELRMTRLADRPVSDLGEAQRGLLQGPVPGASECFAIRVVDQATRRGVPLVFLRSESTTYVSDSQGMVAVCPPQALPASLELAVDSHGYSFAARSVRLDARAGASATLELVRENVAERLARVTGQGIYRDSYLLGLTSPRPADQLLGRVVRQDSVGVAVLDGERFWLWGNTDYPDYPLGNFFGSAARSATTADDAATYDHGALELDYLTDADDKARAIGNALEPTNLASWLGPLIVVRDAASTPHLFAAYSKPQGDLSLAARGLAELSEDDRFESAASYPVDDFVGPGGQPLHLQHGDEEYVYFSTPLRIPARPAALRNTSRYELYTAFADANAAQLQRRADGSLDYQFRAGAKPTTREDLDAEGVPQSQALTGHLIDVSSGVGIAQAGDGATARAEYRGRFVRIFQQLGGVSSFAGELWYAEADTPMGPWVYATKVLTHDRYSFYAPFIHSSFFEGDGRLLYFEGSYTTALAGDDVTATPRYERNQISYRLDLSDPRLAMPVAIYPHAPSGDLRTASGLRGSDDVLAPAFYAPDRPAPGTRAVHWSGPSCAARELRVSDSPNTPPLFYAIAPDDPARPSIVVPLYAYTNAEGDRAYTAAESLDGFERAPEPLAYVWPSPSAVRSRVSSYLPDAWASAGEDQCLTLSEDANEAVVELRGEAFLRADESLARVAWRLDDNSCPVAETLDADVSLSPGVHTLTLEVESQTGMHLRDALIVEVSGFR